MEPTVFSLADAIEAPDDGWLQQVMGCTGTGTCSFFSLTGGCTSFGLVFLSAGGAASIGLMFICDAARSFLLFYGDPNPFL